TATRSSPYASCSTRLPHCWCYSVKLARIRQAMRDENWDEALKLAARFQRLGEHAEAIRRAASGVTNPAFYEDLRANVAQGGAQGIAALKERYSKSWEEVQEQQSRSG